MTTCDECHGDGRVRVTRTLTVTVPPCVDTGSTLRMKGEGEAGSAGHGDLFVVVEVPPHRTFKRKGSDLLVEVTVSVAKAILGAEIRVPTMDGAVMMKIPAPRAGARSGFGAKGCLNCAARASGTSW